MLLPFQSIRKIALVIFTITFLSSTLFSQNDYCIDPLTWQPVEQPKLDSLLNAAPDLEFINAGASPKHSWGGNSFLVPNADGNSWDILSAYYSGYGGSGEIIINDLATGEKNRQVWGDNEGDTITTYYTDFHMRPAHYTKGKMVFCVWIKGKGISSLSVMFIVYDPTSNEFTNTIIPNPPGEFTSLIGGVFDMNEEGMIYGIAWDGANDGFLPVSFDAETMEVKVYDKIFPDNQVFNLTVNYRDCKATGDWAYASIGNSPWRLIAHNFKTGEGKILAETEEILGDHRTIGLNEVVSGNEGGVQGYIRQPAYIEGVTLSNNNEYPFWIYDGDIYHRTSEFAPWSGEKAVESGSPEFSWDNEGQYWPSNFTPSELPLDVLVDGSDVIVNASDATLSVVSIGEKGWNRIVDTTAYAGMAIQADSSLGLSNKNGIASVDVTFTERGTYYLYYRARTSDLDEDGGVGNNDTPTFSEGDGAESPWSTTSLISASNQVRAKSFSWNKAWKTNYGNSFIYSIDESEVGVVQSFKIGTYDAGVTIDQLLFSQDSAKLMSLLPIIDQEDGTPDIEGQVEIPYVFYESNQGDTLQFEVKMYNGIVRHLKEIDENTLVATDAGYGQTVFYNLSDNTLERIDGKISPYSMAVSNDKARVYISGYPNSQLYSYDLTSSFTSDKANPNPKLVAHIGDSSDVHASFGTEIGADGNVYCAGTTYGRQREGGGFGWYNTTEETTGGFWDPQFTNFRAFWTATADDSRYILISTKPVEDDYEGKLYCWDTETHEFISEINYPGVFVPGPIVEVSPDLLIGYTLTEQEDLGRLYGFRASTGEVFWQKDVPDIPITPFSSVRKHEYSFRQGSDDMIWAFFDHVLVQIDPRNIEIKVVGRIHSDPAELAFAKNNVYIAGGDSLRQLKGVHPVDEITPCAPINLSSRDKSYNLELSWNRNKEKDLVSYNIYRSLGSDGEFTFVGNVQQGQTDYLDSDVEVGTSYCYRVSAIDDAGNESGLSEMECHTAGTSTISGLNVDLKQSVHAYPNPTTGSILIESESEIIKQIIIRDLTGKILMKDSNASLQQKINLSEYPGGLYILQIATDNSNMQIKVVRE